MSTLHILSSPHTAVNLNNRIDPFSPIVFKYIKYMNELGWKTIHYGIEGCDVPSETVICGDGSVDNGTYNTEVYNHNAAKEIANRKKPGDLILCFYGSDNWGAASEHKDLKIIEPSIGYSADAVFAPFRIFASYAQMHYYYGKTNMLMKPSWTDRVIYNAITPDEFDFKLIKDDYILFFGRVIETKGIHIAIKATEIAGKKLIVAGPGNPKCVGFNKIPSHVEFIGIADIEKRRSLMSNAKAIIAPTLYIEPFGNMIAEAFMSGTPAITTDWGGFTESVINGVTGFRCRSVEEFAEAIDKINSIDSYNCRKWAIDHCEDKVVHLQHHRYLQMVQN